MIQKPRKDNLKIKIIIMAIDYNMLKTKIEPVSICGNRKVFMEGRLLFTKGCQANAE